MDQVVQVFQGLAILGAFWLVNTLLGIHNNLSQGFKWDWKKFRDGATQAVLICVSILVYTMGIHFFQLWAKSVGINLDEASIKAISLLGLLGGIGSGIIFYASKGLQNIVKLLKAGSTVELEIKPSETDFNRGEIIYKSVKEFDPDAEEVTEESEKK